MCFMVQVGTKVSAVSRKTNTTIHEVVGVMTRGDTQIVCQTFFKFINLCTSFLCEIWI